MYRGGGPEPTHNVTIHQSPAIPASIQIHPCAYQFENISLKVRICSLLKLGCTYFEMHNLKSIYISLNLK
jgi:hypothetical protein